MQYNIIQCSCTLAILRAIWMEYITLNYICLLDSSTMQLLYSSSLSTQCSFSHFSIRIVYNNGRKDYTVDSCHFHFLQFMTCLLHYLTMNTHPPMYPFPCICFQLSLSFCSLCHFYSVLLVSLIKRVYTFCLYYATDQDSCKRVLLSNIRFS